jgi:hypothetical protein
MGGRGSSSMSGRSAGSSLIGGAAAMSAKDWDGLIDVANANGIPLHESLKTIPLETAKTALAGVIDVAEAFPQVDRDLLTLHAEYRNNTAMAWTSLRNGITVNSKYFASADNIESAYARGVSSGFHPNGQARAITSHEAGHIIEAHLVHQQYKDGLTYGAIADWNKSRIASGIINQASKSVKKTTEGKGMKIADQIRQVSGYATKNRSEALAECVADYISNGNNAKPLSREVWGILKQKLG